MIKDLLAAQRYAQALFELSKELGKDEAVEAELESLSESLKNTPAIEKFLANPSLKTEEKSTFMKKLYPGQVQQVQGLLLNFFTVLFKKNRFYLIHEIAVSFKKIADEAQGQGVAEVRSAAALKPSQQERILNRLEKMSGRKLTVKSIVDASLIGGVTVKIRNKVIDDSVRTKIQAIKKELMSNQSV